MRDYPKEDYEKEDLKNLKAENWMVDTLKMNPDYNCWGNGEDYMWTKEKSGWNASLELDSVNDLWDLDDLNELVNFHFEVVRASVTCEDCEGSGLNPATKKISEDWYSFDDEEWIWIVPGERRYNNKAWSHHLTEVEVEALVKAGRLTDLTKRHVWFDEKENQWTEYKDGKKVVCDPLEYPSPEIVNEWSKEGLAHDGINQSICVEARARSLGVYGYCDKCDGDGHTYTEPHAHLSIQLWFLHPRKGASRGVYLKNINKDELNTVVEYLQKAAQRNTDRFSRLNLITA